MSFTPGPWVAQRTRGRQVAIDRKWEVVAPQACGEQVVVGEHTGVDCLKEQDARLIAAAPEMFAALVECEELLADLERGGAENPELQTARAAIAKAKGQS